MAANRYYRALRIDAIANQRTLYSQKRKWLVTALLPVAQQALRVPSAQECPSIRGECDTSVPCEISNRITSYYMQIRDSMTRTCCARPIVTYAARATCLDSRLERASLRRVRSNGFRESVSVVSRLFFPPPVGQARLKVASGMLNKTNGSL